MKGEPSNGDASLRDVINTEEPQSARVWNYWLGGKDNYPVDRMAGDAFVAMYPGIVDIARQSRYFLIRVVRFLAGEAGLRQFLDVGTGLPTIENTHEVAQRTAPGATVVYVDNDPMVLAHARVLLTSDRLSTTSYIDADLHAPENVLREAGKILDFSRPIALLLMGILGHIQDYDEARSIVGTLVDALPSGSCLGLYDGTENDPGYSAATDYYNAHAPLPYILRSPHQIAGYFDGLQLVEPGVVSCPRWRPEGHDVGREVTLEIYGGVGLKP